MQANVKTLQDAICDGFSYSRITKILSEIEDNLNGSTFSLADVINQFVPGEAEDEDYNSLILATSMNSFDILRLLVQKGGDVEHKLGNCVLTAAVYLGNSNIIQWLLEAVSTNPNTTTSLAISMLSVASFAGRLDVVKYLIEAAKANRNQFSLSTALHHACMGGYLPIVSYLVETLGTELREDMFPDVSLSLLLEESDWDDDIVEYLQAHFIT